MAAAHTDYNLKIIIIGNSGVGKTAILQKYIVDEFVESPAIGIDFFMKHISIFGKVIGLQLWHLPGSERWEFVRSSHFRQLHGIILVFDVAYRRSFYSLRSWLKEIEQNGVPDNVITVLVGNKCDLKEKREVSTEEAVKFAELHKILYIETSAKTGYNIHKMFELIVERILEMIVKEKAKEKKLNEILLRKNLNRAKKEQRTISVRFLKLFFTGSGAAGKTSFINLLLKRKFNRDHHSTNVVHTNHAVSIKKAVLHGSTSEVTWIEFDSELEISHLHSILLPKPLTTPVKLPPNTKGQPSQILMEKVDPAMKPVTTINQHISPKPQQFSITQWFAGLFVSSVKDSNLSTFDNIIDATLPKSIMHQPGEILNIITLLDTGGQPEYIHLLPTINIYPTVTFVIHDLSKSLSDQVLVEYSQHGKHVFTPYHLSYSNLDMIKLLLSAANDSIERSTTDIPQLITIPGNNKKSYICLVGTHADKVQQKTKTEIENELKILVNKAHCEKAVWRNDIGGVLFPVDNTTSGNGYAEDPVANVIRNRIETIAKEKDIYELPITWMLLELEIRNVCSKKQKAYILFCDCVTLARETGLMSKQEEVKSVLQYHHQLGVLIYFDEVPGLCDYVIMDHQWWFDKLSNIISSAFQQSSYDCKAEQKLKYQGLLSKELLQHVGWKDDIKEEFFLSLLVQMRIVAPVFAGKKDVQEYFIPFILPTCNLQQNSKLLDQYGHLCGEPLLVHFQSGLLPRGMFCSVIVELLQHSPKGWHPHFSHKGVHHTFSNLISFRLHEGYSLLLLDKVSYLEVQIRHGESDFSIPVHNGVYNYLVYALTEVCIHLNFDYERLQYGFVCQCSEGIDNHIAVLPEAIPSMHYAECSINSLHSLKLEPLHLIWFSSVHTSSFNRGIYADVVQKVKDNYNDLINLNTTAMLPSLFAKSVITLVDKDTISLTKSLERDKMQYLLDQIIIPSLQAGVIQKFKLFLEVMENSEDTVTKTVAQKLGTQSYLCSYRYIVLDNTL